ncbi:enoyl-CoA hydratase/isomerase family protein [Sphingobium sp. HWE2-09]|uniref:enoyl-CoA hydratase/isomerase family protein n=1 Tax=Sphingobium sp. HWE2-09 TaxID=3108390 RepID=UPI002DC35D82|nr:enoyl-CoA hydratase-related protein [Sphingobium sp. HWE2-09]
MDETILFAKENGWATITLNRPDELNAVNAALIVEMTAALARAEHDPDIRCVIITGAGRAFCAGADLKFVSALPAGDKRNAAIEAFLHDINALMLRIECLSKPVIAAVNGLAIGGGLELLLSCDLVIAAETAKISDGHANFGLLPGAGASVRLPRKLGLTRAKYLFFTADLISAGDPIFAQLINEVVPDQELLVAVEQLARKIAVKSPLGLRHMKNLANSAFDVSLSQALDLEQAINRSYASSHDRAEGIAAFNERRKPVFSGH